MQKRFAGRTLDTSSTWIEWGANNKLAINLAYELVWNLTKNSTKVQRSMRKNKTEIAISGKSGILPADFDTIVIVSSVSFIDDSDLYKISSNRIFEFEVLWRSPNKIIQTAYEWSSVFISYVPLRVDLTDNTDQPELPNEFDDRIIDFAMFFYNQMIRDPIEAQNSMNFANDILNETISKLW